LRLIIFALWRSSASVMRVSGATGGLAGFRGGVQDGALAPRASPGPRDQWLLRREPAVSGATIAAKSETAASAIR